MMSSTSWSRPRKPLVIALAIATAAACIKTSHGQQSFQGIDKIADILTRIWPEHKHDIEEKAKEFKESTVERIEALMDIVICNKADYFKKRANKNAIDLVPQRREDNSASLLIMENSQKMTDQFHYVESLNEKINYYNSHLGYFDHYDIKNCNDENPSNEEFQVCKFNPEWLGNHCSEVNSWGYKSKSPCIIVQMNNLVNWTPDVYQTIEELPTDMPEDLVTHIKEQTNDNGGRVPQMLWLNCKGQKSDDNEYIGEVEYTPWRGFPSYYFPFIDYENYVGPMVAVRFVAPSKNILINIECRVYSKNISHSTSDNDDNDLVFGVMNFELFIDEHES